MLIQVDKYNSANFILKQNSVEATGTSALTEFYCEMCLQSFVVCVRESDYLTKCK